MKKYIAQIDISIIEVVPQKAQVDILKNFLKKEEEIINYSIENIESRMNFLSLKNILKDNRKVNGIIFFSLIQFCYNESNILDINLLKNILKNHSVIFFRENLRIKNLGELKKVEKNLKIFKHNNLNIINKFKY